MRTYQCAAAFVFALFTWAAHAAEPARVQPSDLHLEQLRPATLTYLVYMHDGPGSGMRRPMLATTRVAREPQAGAEAWVIEQHWEDETGVVHTARTVHDAGDAATLSQTSAWTRPDRNYRTTIDPPTGEARIEGELAEDARVAMEAGFAAMRDGWWLNWHSDLTLLPLLPFERGGTLRVRLFDVGLPGPMDVDYTVLGERTLQAGDGSTYECWLVETESGDPGNGNYQRFWIDKARRVVVKEEVRSWLLSSE